MSSADIPADPEQRAAQERAKVLMHPAAERGREAESSLPPPLDWEALAEDENGPPPRDWVLDEWVGMGHVTLLSGAGSVGKSILTQQLITAASLGKPFIASVKQPRVAIGWMGEDDHGELWRRQENVCRKLGVGLDTLRGRLYLYAMDRYECCLLDIFEGRPVRTSTLTQLREQIGDLKAELVALDNIGCVFGGNENDRHHVSSFFAALRWASEPTEAAIILLGHVAKTTQGSGKEFSGSTAWENKARNRIWMTDKPPDAKTDDDSEAPQTDLRYVAKRKVNYSSRDLAVLRYEQGAYDVVTAPSGGLVASIDRRHAKAVVLACLSKLQAMGIDPNESTNSPHFLPSLIIGHSLSEGFAKFDLTKAMRELMTDGVLLRKPIGQYSNRTPKYGLVLGSAIPASSAE